MHEVKFLLGLFVFQMLLFMYFEKNVCFFHLPFHGKLSDLCGNHFPFSENRIWQILWSVHWYLGFGLNETFQKTFIINWSDVIEKHFRISLWIVRRHGLDNLLNIFVRSSMCYFTEHSSFIYHSRSDWRTPDFDALWKFNRIVFAK